MGRGIAGSTLNSLTAVLTQLGEGDWNDGDRRVIKRLHKAVQEVIEHRNELAHGLLLAGPPDGDLGFRLGRMTAGPGRDLDVLRLPELAALIERLDLLERVVLNVSAVCVGRAMDLDYPRVEDVVAAHADGRFDILQDVFQEH